MWHFLARHKVSGVIKFSFLSRLAGNLSYNKLFIIAMEGSKTEIEYFNRLSQISSSSVRIKTLEKGLSKSAPKWVLELMKKYITDEGLKKNDEAWLVVDKDSWSDAQLKELFDWSTEDKKHGFSLSNPKFEYWLLLHFEDKKIKSIRDCEQKLDKHFPDYKKGICANKITKKSINDAIERAKKRDAPQCKDWPRTMGCTTVYRLVEKILQEN